MQLLKSLGLALVLIALIWFGYAAILKQDRGDGTGTVAREPTIADEDEPFTARSENCSVGLRVKIGLHEIATDRTVLTHNLAHGFSEVVIPRGYNGIFVQFEPAPEIIAPYEGTFTGIWNAEGVTQTASARGNAGNLVDNFARARRSAQWGPAAGNAGTIQTHSVIGRWNPDDGEPCEVEHSFQVIFAGDDISIPPLDLGDFYGRHRNDGFGRGTTTRPYYDNPPEPKSVDSQIVVPTGIYWEVGPDCCGITRATPKVIQFARAAIEGPNGRYAKPWTLDISSSEARRSPRHDPTYTNNPRSDANETPSNANGGGTRREGSGLTQWDAPGMPNGLYHRLLHAEGASTYKQQFLSLLVCRRGSNHTAESYRQNALIKEIGVMTATWQFPGQRGVDRSNPANLRQPTINVAFNRLDGGCRSLDDFLTANNLSSEFNNPEENARNLEILSQGAFDEVSRDISEWERNPAGQIQ